MLALLRIGSETFTQDLHRRRRVPFQKFALIVHLERLGLILGFNGKETGTIRHTPQEFAYPKLSVEVSVRCMIEYGVTYLAMLNRTL